VLWFKSKFKVLHLDLVLRELLLLGGSVGAYPEGKWNNSWVRPQLDGNRGRGLWVEVAARHDLIIFLSRTTMDNQFRSGRSVGGGGESMVRGWGVKNATKGQFVIRSSLPRTTV
jgi:hypothetical protein